MLRGGLLNAACVRGEIAPLLPTLSLRLQRMVASSQAFQAAQCELSGGNLEGTITTSTKVAERRGFRAGWSRKCRSSRANSASYQARVAANN